MLKTANLTGPVSRNAGGLYESVRRLVQQLMEENMDVRVMGLSDEFTAADIGAWSPAKIHAFKPYWPEAFGYSPEYLRELLSYRPDLTHTHGIWRYTSIATNNYCRISETPYIISPHGMLDPWAVRNSRWKKVIAHILYEGAHLQNATCLRALCESEAQSFRLFGLKNPVVVIPNGIDLPTQTDYETTGQQKGGAMVSGQQSVVSSLKSEGHKTLLYLGRIHPKKGLANLLRAWQQTLNAQPSAKDWTLAIAGWDQGGHEAELKKLATELRLAWQDCKSQNTSPLHLERGEGQAEVSNLPSVIFLGSQFNEAKAECYRNCDAFILPSFSEGLPMVVLEAWANGKPVMMTPECNLPEGFAAEAAVRIETNPDSIARGLQALFSMSARERREMGGRGLQLASTQFSWKFVARQLKHVYDWMLGGGLPPDCIYPR
jgi:poly(glycerol-phosphate) alpha-glucosyltransferase